MPESPHEIPAPQDQPGLRRKRIHIKPSMPGWVSESEKAKMFGQSVRQAIRERMEGRSPPYVKRGATVFYRLAGIERHMLDMEIDPSKPAKLSRRSRKAG
jgi:hypothetical protein